MADTADRVQETATTTGTGNFTLAGAATGYRTFNAALGLSVQFYYCIDGGTSGEWEVGEGHLSASTTLVRDTVLASSNAGALVNFSAGSKTVFATAPARMLRSPESLAVAVGATTPAPAAGERPIIWSTLEQAHVQWNGTSWGPLSPYRPPTIPVKIAFNSKFHAVLVNTAQTLLRWNTALTSGVTVAQGDLIYLPGYEYDGNIVAGGLYVLGSVSDLSAIPLTAHPDFPATQVLLLGSRITARYTPASNVSIFREQVDGTPLYSTSVNTTTEELSIYAGTTLDSVVKLLPRSGGTTPAPLATGQVYFVVADNFGVIKLGNTQGGAAIDLTTTGSGPSDVTSYYVSILPSEALTGDFLAVFTLRDRTASFTLATLGTAGGPVAERVNNPLDVAIGVGTTAIGEGVAVGFSASAANSGTALGRVSVANGSVSVAVGSSASAGTNAEATAVGGYSGATAVKAIALGAFSSATGQNSSALGAYATALEKSSLAIGYLAEAENPSEVAIQQSSWDSLGQGFGWKRHTYGQLSTNATPLDMLAWDSANSSISVGTRRAYVLSGYVFAHGATDSSIWKVEAVLGSAIGVTTNVLSFRCKRVAGTAGANSWSIRLRSTEFISVALYIEVTGAAGTTIKWLAQIEGIQVDNENYADRDLTIGVSNFIDVGPTINVVTSEALSAGDQVNLWNSSGAKARKANASAGYAADGYVLQNYGSGATACVMLLGECPFMSGLTVGPLYLGTTAGTVTSTPPGTGNLVQRVGFALSATKMLFQRETPIQT